MIEIQEPDKNRRRRWLYKTFFELLLGFCFIMGLFFILIAIIIKEITLIVLSISCIVIVCFFMKNFKVARILTITNSSIVLEKNTKRIELYQDNIAHAHKIVKFSITKHYLMILSEKGKNFLSRKRYILLNDPQNDLIALLLKFGIPLRNI